jgi:acyl-CoA synthetase (AMP-forming)/AMP-acid ligase II
MPAFNPKIVLGELKAVNATHVFSAPAHFSPFVANNLLTPDVLAGIRYLCLSGAPVPPVLAEALDAMLPDGGVAQLWGMSELQAGTYTRPGDQAEMRYSTAGRPAPGMELRVLDDHGHPLPAGQEGALEVRGPSVFAGYLNRAEETRNSFDADGWFATGDLAVINADGFMTITGRTKELINRGGVKFNPVEVEEVLGGLPVIQQCAIVPIADPDLGERACLCAELTPDTSLALDEVLAFLSEAGMAKYKWPERLEVLESLPMTPTRKVMRGKLVEQITKPAG